MDKKILSALEILQKTVTKIQTDMVSVKKDIVLIKSDLGGVKKDMVGVKKDMVGVKKDMVGVKKDMVGMKSNMVTKEEAKNFATKNDLKILRSAISDDLGGIVNEFVAELDNKKADKAEVEYLKERVKIVERKVASQ